MYLKAKMHSNFNSKKLGHAKQCSDVANYNPTQQIDDVNNHNLKYIAKNQCRIHIYYISNHFRIGNYMYINYQLEWYYCYKNKLIFQCLK